MRAFDPSASMQRPSPEALLAEAAAERRGKLKIFVGAAPGVGKTYEMLQAAAARKREGVDVVIGLVETHGRAETEVLVRGLEAIPRRRVPYHGHALDEMDIDAVLARKPALALVDELAHTNAPESRHPKRYMDVEELLAAGIDVYTTLNVQHVESLNDVVAQITRIRVRETLPDSVLDRADEIEVVDITPADLIQRLREGKVYVRDQAQRALKHYFSPGNLTALRELALRLTAQRVDAQMLNYMKARAISGPWATAQRLLVCVSESPFSAQLVRRTRRIADELKASWIALYVETPRHQRLGEVERDRIADTLRLAETLGAQSITVPGERMAADIVAFARANNVTQIVLGRTGRPRWYEWLHGSIAHDVIRNAGNIGIQIVVGEGEPVPAKVVATRADARIPSPVSYLFSAGFVGVSLICALVVAHFIALPDIAMTFLPAVMVTAILYGLWPSLVAALLSVLAYNFFFLPPLYTFTIADPANVLAMLFLGVVALLTSQLMARVRAQIVSARSRARLAAELHGFSRKLAGIGNLDDLLWAFCYQVASMLHVRAVVLLDEDHEVVVRAAYPPEDELDHADLAAAKWARDHNRPAGRGADTLPGGRRLFLPLRTARGPVGIVGVDADRSGPFLTPDERRLLDALSDQAAVAIERIRLVDDLDEARIQAETERLRATLLSSISHDLRTPLASIIGAITTLGSAGPEVSAEARRELVATVRDEAERLNRFVGNLLDITRLESGTLTFKRETVDLIEVVETALRRADRILVRHRVTVHIMPTLPMIEIDVSLFEQALFNLLDNAAKYAPPGSQILIAAEAVGADVRVIVEDEGPGIPVEQIAHIFDKFQRTAHGDTRPAGTGLGLSICRGFIEGLGGRIEAENRRDQSGARFVITLPVAPKTRHGMEPGMERLS